MNEIRLVYWVLVIALGVWAVVELAPEPPTATKLLGANHQLQRGDLQTKPIAALTGRYLRTSVLAGTPITSDMAVETPGPAAIDSGFAIVVNVDRKTVETLHLQERDVVQLRSGNAELGKPGPIRVLICDGMRCTVVIGSDQAPDFDPKLLNGAGLALPPPPGNPAAGG